ncbi:MAG: molecular chaperone Hsp33 [Cyclobacteriaceae bacterium]|jgi:molecular chaperone Hsp33
MGHNVTIAVVIHDSGTAVSDMSDYSQRFLFDKTDIRGDMVHLDQSYLAIAERYPPAVAKLLGQFLSASVLLGSTIKFDGRLVLQARGAGELKLVVAECRFNGDIRGVARLNGDVASDDFSVLLGAGTLVMTIESASGQSYQSLVPLSGENLAACLEFYFLQSEQLETRIWLSSDLQRAGGLLLQQLPRQLVMDPIARARQWEHVTILAATTSPEELLDLAPAELLQRLYVEDPVRLTDLKPIQFQCSCTPARTANALVLLGQDEVDELFEELPEVVMDCEFCGHQYTFTKDSLAEVLRAGEVSH